MFAVRAFATRAAASSRPCARLAGEQEVTSLTESYNTTDATSQRRSNGPGTIENECERAHHDGHGAEEPRPPPARAPPCAYSGGQC